MKSSTITFTGIRVRIPIEMIVLLIKITLSVNDKEIFFNEKIKADAELKFNLSDRS